MTRRQVRHLKKAFLEAFARCGNVSAACRQAGIPNRTDVYQWQEHDDAFALSFKQAEIEATEYLEAEAWRRATDGVQSERGVYHNGEMLERIVETKYSDTLLIFLLKGRAPDKYKERGAFEHSGPGGAPLPFALTVRVVDDRVPSAS
jgi:hypothetical protein